MRRILSTMAAGLLLCGVAACGSTGTPSSAPSSSAPSGPADQASCESAQALTLLASLRMVGVVTRVELADGDPARIGDAAESLKIVSTSADETLAKVTDPRVKAIVEEQKATIGKIQTALTSAAADPKKAAAEVEAAGDELEKSQTKLAAICTTPSTAPSAAAADSDCEAVKKLTMEQGVAMIEPIVSLGAAGTDKAKIAAAVKQLDNAIANYIVAVKELAAKTSNPELKATLEAAAGELAAFRKQLAAAANDPKKVNDLVDNGPSGGTKALEKLDTICSK